MGGLRPEEADQVICVGPAGADDGEEREKGHSSGHRREEQQLAVGQNQPQRGEGEAEPGPEVTKGSGRRQRGNPCVPSRGNGHLGTVANQASSVNGGYKGRPMSLDLKQDSAPVTSIDELVT